MRSPLVLQVEDNADDRQLLQLALRETGIAIDLASCADGEEALEFLHAGGELAARDAPLLPRLVLLDLKLPRVDGFEVLRRIRATPATRLLPVVILTSSLEEEDVLGSYGLGANSYVRKPADFQSFVETTRQICTYWLTLNESPPAHAE